MLATALALTGAVALSAFGLVFGPIFLGLSQTWVLRRHLKRAALWLAVTVMGGWLAVGVGFYLAAIATGARNGLFLLNALAAAVAGIILGLAQWIVLRLHVRWAIVWIPASVLGLVFGASWVIGFGQREAYLTSNYLTSIQWLAVGLLSGAMGGAIKGSVLLWLLRHPRTEH